MNSGGGIVRPGVATIGFASVKNAFDDVNAGVGAGTGGVVVALPGAGSASVAAGVGAGAGDVGATGCAGAGVGVGAGAGDAGAGGSACGVSIVPSATCPPPVSMGAVGVRRERRLGNDPAVGAAVPPSMGGPSWAAAGLAGWGFATAGVGAASWCAGPLGGPVGAARGVGAGAGGAGGGEAWPGCGAV